MRAGMVGRARFAVDLMIDGNHAVTDFSITELTFLLTLAVVKYDITLLNGPLGSGRLVSLLALVVKNCFLT